MSTRLFLKVETKIVKTNYLTKNISSNIAFKQSFLNIIV